MEDLDAFREETRRWFVANAPASMCKPLAAGEDYCWGGRKGRWPADVARWLAAMAERGWTAPTWPREYGGGGLSEEAGKVLAQEMAKLGARPPLVGFGLTMIGPLLLHVGSEQQKRQHLPPIARGEIRWCQGYSEPGAGSDLAGTYPEGLRGLITPEEQGAIAGTLDGLALTNQVTELSAGTHRLEAATNCSPAVVWVGPKLDRIHRVPKADHRLLFVNWY